MMNLVIWPGAVEKRGGAELSRPEKLAPILEWDKELVLRHLDLPTDLPSSRPCAAAARTAGETQADCRRYEQGTRLSRTFPIS